MQGLEWDAPNNPLPEDPEVTSPIREPKRRRLDITSLLKPHTEVSCELALINSQSSPGETNDATLWGSPTQPRSPGPPTPSTLQPVMLFSIFNRAIPNEKKRKAKNSAVMPPATVVRSKPVVGMSRSARAARARNTQVTNGTFVIDNRMLLQFKCKIRLVDPGASFTVGKNIKVVTHSLCGQTVMMKEPYNIAHFLRHTGTCTGPPKTTYGQRNKSVHVPPGGGIFKFLVPRKKGIMLIQSLPCPGLTGSQHHQIPTYLHRSSVPGGVRPT